MYRHLNNGDWIKYAVWHIHIYLEEHNEKCKGIVTADWYHQFCCL